MSSVIKVLTNSLIGNGVTFDMPGQQQRIIFETDAPYYAELLGEFNDGQACVISRDSANLSILFVGPSGAARQLSIADSDPKNLIFPALADEHVWLTIYGERLRLS